MLVIQFVSEEFLPHFWTVMGSSKSCIMGGIVACIMMASQYHGFHLDVAPIQLDIVVPVDVSRPSPAAQWKRLLRAMDYVLVFPQSRPGPYATCVDQVDSYKHLVSPSKLHYKAVFN